MINLTERSLNFVIWDIGDKTANTIKNYEQNELIQWKCLLKIADLKGTYTQHRQL